MLLEIPSWVSHLSASVLGSALRSGRPVLYSILSLSTDLEENSMPETLTDVDKISTKKENKTRKPVTDGIEAREKNCNYQTLK